MPCDETVRHVQSFVIDRTMGPTIPNFCVVKQFDMKNEYSDSAEYLHVVNVAPSRESL